MGDGGEGAEAMPLIACEGGRFLPNERALRWLEEQGAPLVVIACAGAYRKGKSTLLNRGVLDLPPGVRGFGVGATTDACTKGLWVYTATVPLTQGRAVVIDTEGFGAVHVDPNH